MKTIYVTFKAVGMTTEVLLANKVAMNINEKEDIMPYIQSTARDLLLENKLSLQLLPKMKYEIYLTI